MKRINEILFKKIYKIRNASSEDAIKKLKPIFEFKQKLKDKEKAKLKEINNYYFKKIGRQGSLYSNNRWKKDFERSQFFKKNICEFPIINFLDSYNKRTLGDGIIMNKDYNSFILNSSNNYFNDVKFKHLKSLSELKEQVFMSSQENEKNEEIKKKFHNKKTYNKINNYNSLTSRRSNSINNIHTNNIYNNINYNSNCVSNTISNINSPIKEDKLVSLKFIMTDNNTEKNGAIISCKKNTLFSDVLDKLVDNKLILNKNKIKGFYNKNNNNSIIDINKTIANNGLEDNSQILVDLKS